MLNSKLIAAIADAMQRPEGSVEFEYASDDAFATEVPGGILSEVPAGAHVFRLDRTDDRVLRFFHASPGTGTRVAQIALQGLPDFNRAFLAFTWSPQDIHLYCGPRYEGGDLLSAAGQRSDTQLAVTKDGRIFEIGDTGVEVVAFRMREGGRTVLTPSAIEAWTGTLKAIEIMRSGTSDQGFMFEVVHANITIAILVTGFETYSWTRVLELEQEGIKPDVVRLFEKFSSRGERESGRLAEIRRESESAGVSVLAQLLETGRINFQSYEHVKRAYRAAYGLSVGALGVESATLEQIQRYINHRHRIVHVSPLLGILNEQEVPPEEPVFANNEAADSAVSCFDRFISALHAGTLELRPSD